MELFLRLALRIPEMRCQMLSMTVTSRVTCDLYAMSRPVPEAQSIAIELSLSDRDSRRGNYIH